jgi:hypothetical protein
MFFNLVAVTVHLIYQNQLSLVPNTQNAITLIILILTYGNLYEYRKNVLSTYLSANLNIFICNVYIYATNTDLKISENHRVNQFIILLLYFIYYDPVIYQNISIIFKILFV